MLNDLLTIPFASAIALRPEAGIPLHVAVTSAGHERCRSGYAFDGLRRGDRPFAICQCTLRGSGCLQRSRSVFTIGVGQALLVTVPDAHRYWLPPRQTWEHAYLCFHGREALRLVREISHRHGPVVDLAADPASAQAFTRTVTATLDSPGDHCRLSGLLYSLLMALLARCQAPEPLPDVIHTAQTYAHRHLGEPIGVEDLARAAGLSRYHFSRRFRAATGTSPGHWLIQQRLTAALRLLTTDLPLSDIARRCGFADAGYFGKTFARAYGISPGTFRRRELSQ